MKNKRRRVSADQVRDNAKKGGGGGGGSWLNLPEGVREWAPEGAGKVSIDILPYEVTDKHHPDSIDPGTIWYKRLFRVHHGVGAESKSIVCPRSIGKKCPIHEEYEKQSQAAKGSKKGEEFERALKKLRGQGYAMFNIRDPEAESKKKLKVAIFIMSEGKFWSCDAGLKKEIEEGDDTNISFFDVKNGKTLLVRFSEEKFEGNTFLQATRIDFEDRDDMDEEKVLGRTVNLDEVLNVLPYDKIAAMFFQEDEDDEKPKGKKKGKKSKSSDDDEDEDESDDEEEDDSDEDEDDEDDEESDDDDEDEEEDEDEDEEDEKPKRKKKKSRDEDDEDEDDD